MIDELKIEKWLTNNYDIEFVNSPSFVIHTYETVNGEYEKPYVVRSYLYKGIKTFKKLDKVGLKKLYVFKDPFHGILQQHKGFVIIRMLPIYANKRYKLKIKKHV